MRWSDGFCTMNFTSFWETRVRETGKSPLIISGLGFDPRSMQAARLLYDKGIVPKILPIEFSVVSSTETDSVIKDATEKNISFLRKTQKVHEPLKVNLFDDHDRSVGGRQIVEDLYKLANLFKGESDVIIDIGGLPRALFAPIIRFFIDQQADLGYNNLHIASLPYDKLDKCIVSDQLLEPNFMYGFRPERDYKYVWIPVVGKNDPSRLRSIYSKIEKNCIETCPVLPFRIQNPHQIDELIVSLSPVLFDEIRTYRKNIFYVDHRSPFFVYKEIVELSKYYIDLLKDLPGEVRTLITPLDDKTSSVGAILAAVELNLPIMYAETVQYKVTESTALESFGNDEPMEIWITGEAYAS